MVMGVESHPDADDPALVLFGLSNAVILSKPFSSFIGLSCPVHPKSVRVLPHFD